MAHVTEIVATQKLNNGQVSVCIRCCGNPSTDHWHTMTHDVLGDTEKRKASVEQYHDFTARQHANMEKAASEMVLEIGTESMSKTHDI
jgi:hypothetical protein